MTLYMIRREDNTVYIYGAAMVTVYDHGECYTTGLTAPYAPWETPEFIENLNRSMWQDNVLE